MFKINNKVPEYQNLTTELNIKTKGAGGTIQWYLEGAYEQAFTLYQYKI